MNNHNFIISACDTDSITFSKPDQSQFSKDEIQALLNELNSQMPEKVKLDFEEIYSDILVMRAKNYVLHYFDKKQQKNVLKYKGSALRSPTLEPALNEFIQRVVEAIIYDKKNFREIYNTYLHECFYLTNIKRWSMRKTISQKTLESERKNESKIRDAMSEDHVEGDRVFLYGTANDELKLIENYAQDHDPLILVKKLHNTAMRFEPILPVEELFPNYALKKNRQELLEIWEFPQVLKDLPKQWEDIVLTSLSPKLVQFLNTVDWSTTLPSQDNVFRALSYFKPKDTKVIIISQDPYPDRNNACGLAFSTDNPKVPASLQNIFKELKTDLNIDRNSPNLEDWTEQGVLLLNSVLTVFEGNSGSHANQGWEGLTAKIMQQIINLQQPLVILAWGAEAKKRLLDLKYSGKIVNVLTAPHPSPLAQGAFFGCKHFSKCNSFLEKNNLTGIKW